MGILLAVAFDNNLTSREATRPHTMWKCKYTSLQLVGRLDHVARKMSYVELASNVLVHGVVYMECVHPHAPLNLAP